MHSLWLFLITVSKNFKKPKMIWNPPFKCDIILQVILAKIFTQQGYILLKKKKERNFSNMTLKVTDYKIYEKNCCEPSPWFVLSF